MRGGVITCGNGIGGKDGMAELAMVDAPCERAKHIAPSTFWECLFRLPNGASIWFGHNCSCALSLPGYQNLRENTAFVEVRVAAGQGDL